MTVGWPHAQTELRRAFWEALTKALDTTKDTVGTKGDLFEQTLAVSLASYDALPLIGEAAVAAYGVGAEGRRTTPAAFDAGAFFGFRFRGEQISLMDLKARQTAWAVLRTQRLWLRAWEEGKSG